MKRVAAFVLLTMLLIPGVALAGSSTDAALGLGAFAVFNQILSGTGIFGAFNPALGSSLRVRSRSVRKRWNARHADSMRASERPSSPLACNCATKRRTWCSCNFASGVAAASSSSAAISRA